MQCAVLGVRLELEVTKADVDNHPSAEDLAAATLGFSQPSPMWSP